MVATVAQGMCGVQAGLHRALQGPQPCCCAGAQGYCRTATAGVWNATPEPCPAAGLQSWSLNGRLRAEQIAIVDVTAA